MTTKARYDAAHTKWEIGQALVEAEMADIFEYIDELEKALHQEGHKVEFRADGYGLEHPVECRKAGLLHCPVDAALRELPDSPFEYGIYPVALDPDDGLLIFQLPPDLDTIGIEVTPS